MSLDYKSFLLFEEKNKCFEMKSGQLYFWDLIRLYVYHTISRENSFKKFNRTERKSSLIQLFFRIIKIVKNSLFFYYILFFKKNIEYLYFSASREKFNKVNFFDRNLEDIINSSKKNNSITIENFQSDLTKIKNKNVVFNPADLFFKIFSKFFKNYDYEIILKLINKEFPNSNITSDEINKIVNKFRFEYYFYNSLLKLKKPKIIFVTQNGLQKGLFKAAKKNHIHLVEVQHGLINENHLAYNYNKNITYKADQIHLPDYFFIFSEFWTRNIYYPVNRILEIGNSFLFNSFKIKSKKNGLLVVSADIYADNLKKITIDLVKKNYDKPIYFKLHPNQFNEKDYFTKEFSSYKNIHVISFEKNINELLKLSKATLVINSTVIYETLQNKNIGIIYKKKSFFEHSNIFNNPNVYLVDNATDLMNVLSKSTYKILSHNDLFFKDFDNKLFNSFIKNLD